MTQKEKVHNQFTPEQAGILDKHIDKFLEQNLAWSEEDKKYNNIVVSALYNPSIEGLYNFHKVNRSDVITWFKSLKERYAWKPSDEQMKALAWALSLAKNCGEENAFDLRTLHEQLKKLREE